MSFSCDIWCIGTKLPPTIAKLGSSGMVLSAQSLGVAGELLQLEATRMLNDVGGFDEQNQWLSMDHVSDNLKSIGMQVGTLDMITGWADQLEVLHLHKSSSAMRTAVRVFEMESGQAPVGGQFVLMD